MYRLALDVSFMHVLRGHWDSCLRQVVDSMANGAVAHGLAIGHSADSPPQFKRNYRLTTTKYVPLCVLEKVSVERSDCASRG
eukprot:4683631-Alexandrium_andersonii.AAC.1